MILYKDTNNSTFLYKVMRTKHHCEYSCMIELKILLLELRLSFMNYNCVIMSYKCVFHGKIVFFVQHK